ncbi:hypothetical protein ACGFNX_37225 [Streptomyces sp. NPDC048723]|uniref:hypothetical protein n=1 Tax=Streptomyces sp. NPDC048723 TaxID=3365589 RepID=UPI003568A6FC
MLPVVDKPAAPYLVGQAVAAGLTDALMVTDRNRRSLKVHFDRNYEREPARHEKGDAWDGSTPIGTTLLPRAGARNCVVRLSEDSQRSTKSSPSSMARVSSSMCSAAHSTA